MGNPYEKLSNAEVASNNHLQIIKYSPYQPGSRFSLPWLDLRVFYVRVSKFQVDNSTPEFLTLNQIPLCPDTCFEVNGVRSSSYTDGVSSLLRRDRIDKKSEVVTYVSTDGVRLSGSMKFEVFDKEDVILSGILELENSNGFIGDSKSINKRWNMTCESVITSNSGFLKGKSIVGSSEFSCPTIEVYVAGSFAGTPIILTKNLPLGFRKKQSRKGMLDAIPEDDTTESIRNPSAGYDLQNSEDMDYREENEQGYSQIQWRTEYLDGEDGELSWFNAGVRVGVGIGLGICVGVGLGAGLLLHTYQTATRGFKRRPF